MLTSTGTLVNDNATMLYRASKHDCAECALSRVRCCASSLGWRAISHRPDRDLAGFVFISDPRRAADVQIGVRSAIEHHPRARVLSRYWATHNVWHRKAK